VASAIAISVECFCVETIAAFLTLRDRLPTDSLTNKYGTHTMRNMILALAAVGVLTVSSSVTAQSPDQSIVDSAGQTIVEGVQSDVAMHAPMVDHQPMDQSAVAQPIDHQVMTQGQDAMVAQPMVAQPMASQPMVVHQHQPVHYHAHRRPAKQKNVFGKLMDLERRKNAWLKKTFLGK
jgi:hypothetical protein